MSSGLELLIDFAKYHSLHNPDCQTALDAILELLKIEKEGDVTPPLAAD